MKILAIDPGITTGYALVTDDGVLQLSGNLQPEDLMESVLRTFALMPNLLVVMEDTPVPTLGKMNRNLMLVKNQLYTMFPNAKLVAPGVWKTNLAVANYPVPKGIEMTQHQKDAYRLAIWHLVTNEGG
jgi:hypothetical protein